MAEQRVQRLLAGAGFGSRRACEDLIRERRVTVNGTVAVLGDRADPERDRVAVDGSTVNLSPTVRYFALHKPFGVVATLDDPQGRADLREFLPDGPRVFPVGRLDRETEGLLLLTNDGELANRLMHPRYGVEKEYLAEVSVVPTRRHLSQLRRGVPLEDGPAGAIRAKSAGAAGGRGAVRVVMGEGRKREVRRLLAAVGLPVERLVRLRVGPVRLGGLPPGELRELDHAEVRGLYRAAGL